MTKVQARIISTITVYLLSLLVWQIPTFAQSSPKPGDPQAAPRDDKTPANPSGGSPTKSDSASKTDASNKTDSASKDDSASKTKNPASTAEIIAELERMQARIQELEAQLKAQSGDASAAAPTVVASSTTTPPAPGNAAQTSQAAASPGVIPNAASGSQTPDSAGTSSSASTGATAGTSGVLQTLDNQAKPVDTQTPFAFADFTWLNGSPRTKDLPLDTKFFTPEIRADVSYIEDFAHPADHTIDGSTEVFRSGEVQLADLGIGGDFHYDNVRARFMTQLGLYSQTTPRNDASPSVGQWDLADTYRYISEAYGGYHFDVLHGVNVDAGIFLSYIGLFSYYNFDNWAYQPSYVSSNTPWFFNGVRTQIFVTNKLKLEPWFINGWQTYGKPNGHPGLGGQIRWDPTGWFVLIANQYGLGSDDVGFPNRHRIHTDDSIEIKYFDKPDSTFDKAALSFTFDAGCEYGQGVSCHGDAAGGPKQSFLGAMLYSRVWFRRDTLGFTVGGGAINNPGRYLVLLPPINGATETSGTPYFTENPGDPFKAWDISATFDYMPKQYITFRWEYDYRASNVPYFAGHGGETPPGGNTGAPGSLVPGFTPDLRKYENTLNMALLVKF